MKKSFPFSIPYEETQYGPSFAPSNLFWKFLLKNSRSSLAINIPDTIIYGGAIFIRTINESCMVIH